MCAPSAAAAPSRAPMSAGDLRAELVGRSFDSGAATLAVDRSCVVTLDAKGDRRRGPVAHHRRRAYCRGGTRETAAGDAATGCTATARRSGSTRSTGGP
jgi:hypothetical protein